MTDREKERPHITHAKSEATASRVRNVDTFATSSSTRVETRYSAQVLTGQNRDKDPCRASQHIP